MFGCICSGRPVQTNLQIVSDTEALFLLPNAHAINHIVVFLLPETILPPNTAAAIHYSWPGKPFQLLGSISNSKPSAIFQLSGVKPQFHNDINGEEAAATTTIQLGIAVQPESIVQEQIAANHAGRSSQQMTKTVVLARKIIQHAFNYVQSFSQGPAGQEVVQLRAFKEWWNKFESKMVNDPGFLEREE